MKVIPRWIQPYPLSTSTCKSTTVYNANFYLHFAANINGTLTGPDQNNSWSSTNGNHSNQRLHFDLGDTYIISKIYYENYHNSGANTQYGIKDFTFWGSNSSSDFDDLVYANNGTWKQLTTSPTTFAQHAASSNAPDPKYINVSNAGFAYRYYAIKVANSYGTSYAALRHIVLMGIHKKEVLFPLVMRGRSRGNK